MLGAQVYQRLIEWRRQPKLTLGTCQWEEADVSAVLLSSSTGIQALLRMLLLLMQLEEDKELPFRSTIWHLACAANSVMHEDTRCRCRKRT